MHIINMTKPAIIHNQSMRAFGLVAISQDDERRIYRHALQQYRDNASLSGIISRVYSEAARCAMSQGFAA